jgi:hypothetical protein
MAGSSIGFFPPEDRFDRTRFGLGGIPRRFAVPFADPKVL